MLIDVFMLCDLILRLIHSYYWFFYDPARKFFLSDVKD